MHARAYAAADSPLGLPPPNYFVIDGKVVTQDPFEHTAPARYNHVPIINGLVEDEQAFFHARDFGRSPPPRESTGSRICGLVQSYGAENVAGIERIYPLSSFASPSLAEIALAAGTKACIARQFDRGGRIRSVYAYQFDDENAPSYFPPVSYPTRAFHTSELEYSSPSSTVGKDGRIR